MEKLNMKTILFALVLLTGSMTLAQKPNVYIYEGPWKTKERRLDGIMTSVVEYKGKQKWKGRFYGTWQGVDFDYNVDFQGYAKELKGVAVIDGAHYQWTGRISEKEFVVQFTGDRYNGSFDLKRKDKQ